MFIAGTIPASAACSVGAARTLGGDGGTVNRGEAESQKFHEIRGHAGTWARKLRPVLNPGIVSAPKGKEDKTGVTTQPRDEFRLELSDAFELLADMGREFVSSRDITVTLANALARINDYVGAEGAALFLLDEDGKTLSCTACAGATDIVGLSVPAGQGIVGRCVANNEGDIVRDVRDDPNFFAAADAETGFVTRSILCAPLSVKDEPIGAIELVNKRSGDHLFAPADLTFLETLSASAALAVQNARMAEALLEQERVKRELELAAEIQRSLLPPADAAGPVQGINIPARTVSGDFFDFFELDDGRIAFNLGDVSGKGMNAALLMAKTASLYRCLGKEIRSPGKLLGRINAEICETAARGMFVTMAGGIYDPKTGVVRIANAGHEPPLVQAASGGFETVPADAPPLGISPYVVDDDGYPEVEIPLAGGALYIFTDGLTEGYRADGSEMGADGVQALLSEHHGAGPADRVAAVVAPLTWPGVKLRDDLTILAVDDRDASTVRVPAAAQEAQTSAAENGETLVRLEFHSRPDRLRLIRRAVNEAVLLGGCSPPIAQDIVLAVDEALQNVIRHAYQGRLDGAIILEVRRAVGERLAVTIRDYADPVDVAKIKPRDLDDVRPGGLGTHFIREVMDEVTFSTPSDGAGGNLLRMVRAIE